MQASTEAQGIIQKALKNAKVMFVLFTTGVEFLAVAVIIGLLVYTLIQNLEIKNTLKDIQQLTEQNATRK